MIIIKDKEIHDPVADFHILDAYLRWALLAAEEVVGHKGMPIVLREAKLPQLVNNYPDNEFDIKGGFTFGDYANLSAALLNFFGRAGKSMTIRIGRRSAEHAVEQQASTFGLNTLVKASRLLPLAHQQKAGLAMMQTNFDKLSKSLGQNVRLRLEDRGDKIAYIDETCPLCAGKSADSPICWVHNGVLFQSALWLTGKEFDVTEVECRAKGDPACIWEVSKMPIN